MDLLALARGPLLGLSIAVFLAGITWRLYGIYRLGRKPVLSAPRSTDIVPVAVRSVFARMLPRSGFHPSATLATVNPYVYHLGLAIVAFAYAPHISFIRDLAGASWPALPDSVVYVAAGATIVSLGIALLYRLTDPVLKLISTFDDHCAWIVTMLPLATGMALVAEPSAAVEARDAVVYPVPLALHLLSVELLLVWFPFGKLMHGFLFAPGRWQLGAFLARRGVRP
jgi:nitrate reductase gamma subunit